MSPILFYIYFSGTEKHILAQAHKAILFVLVKEQGWSRLTCKQFLFLLSLPHFSQITCHNIRKAPLEKKKKRSLTQVLDCWDNIAELGSGENKSKIRYQKFSLLRFSYYFVVLKYLTLRYLTIKNSYHKSTYYTRVHYWKKTMLGTLIISCLLIQHLLNPKLPAQFSRAHVWLCVWVKCF